MLCDIRKHLVDDEGEITLTVILILFRKCMSCHKGGNKLDRLAFLQAFYNI